MIRKDLWLVLLVALVLGFPWLASSVASNLETPSTTPTQPQQPCSPAQLCATLPTAGPQPAVLTGTPNLGLDLMILIAGLFVITYLAWRRGGQPGRRTGPYRGLDPLGMVLAACVLLAMFEVIDLLRGNLPTVTGPSLPLFYIPLAAIATAIVIAGFMVLRRTGSRLASAPWRPGPSATEERKEFATVLGRASQSLKAGDDPRSVIIECYRALCQVLQKRGAVNTPSMTAREFEVASQRRLAIRPDLLHQFTALFEKARYSDEEILKGEASESASMLDTLKSEIGVLEAR